jgi:hypothetical protein
MGAFRGMARGNTVLLKVIYHFPGRKKVEAGIITKVSNDDSSGDILYDVRSLRDPALMKKWVKVSVSWH